MPLTIDRPAVSAPDAGVIQEARTRQRRHRALAAAATVAALVGSRSCRTDRSKRCRAGRAGRRGGSRKSDSPRGTPHGDATSELAVANLARVLHSPRLHRSGLQPHAGVLPPPSVGRAARRRPPVVVPPNQVRLSIGFASIRTSATPWKHWRLSNRELRPYHPVIDPISGLDPNRIRAEVVLTPSGVATAAAALGSMPMSNTALAAANSVLRSIRVGPNYACR